MSLREFLRFRQFKEKAAYVPRESARLNALLNEYLIYGGFPEVVLSGQDDTKKHLLSGYLDTMLLRDVIEKNGVSNVPVMTILLNKMINSFTRHFSVHKWYNDFKSLGYRVSKDTLYTYVSYLAETGFIQRVSGFNKSSDAAQKIYIVDNGLYAVRNTARRDIGKLFENAVWTHLVRNGVSPTYFNSGRGEVDFVCDDTLVQCCHTLTAENQVRELAGFEQFESLYPPKARQLVVQEMPRNAPNEAVSFYDFAMS